MAGITDLTVRISTMTPAQKSTFYDHWQTLEWDYDLEEQFGGTPPTDYFWLGNVGSQQIEEVQAKVLDFLAGIGVRWRAAQREMDDFDAGWWEADGAFHAFDPFHDFDRSA